MGVVWPFFTLRHALRTELVAGSILAALDTFASKTSNMPKPLPVVVRMDEKHYMQHVRHSLTTCYQHVECAQGARW